LSQLKPKFINHPTSKDLVRGILAEMGCNPGSTYFDVPRMRTATSDGYLTSGIAYAFHPHRDTWYSAPTNQINWWMPIYDIEPDSAMAFHTRYWYTPIANESNEFNYYEYVQTSRKDAAKHVKKDTRKQPRPTAPVELNPQLRVIARAGGVLLFSGAHLHSTVPNTTGRTRFSIDFRTVHLDDVKSKDGAPNVDSACTGTALRDFMRANDLSRIPEELVVPYESMADIRPSLDEVG
jgi:ectoine hydroxylase-related dioxygenase (phytanoyl-CoA dioxygenase family)